MILNLNHVAIVVPQVAEALTFWRDTLGLNFSYQTEVPEQKVTVAFLPVGGSEVELLEPTDPDSGVGRYLAKHGSGIHHLCFEVDDIRQTLQLLKAKGVRLIDETPKNGPGGRQIAFVHPVSTGGVLVELYQAPPDRQ